MHEMQLLCGPSERAVPAPQILLGRRNGPVEQSGGMVVRRAPSPSLQNLIRNPPPTNQTTPRVPRPIAPPLALAMDAAERRLARVTAHLLPSLPLPAPPLAPSPAAASSSPASDSYRRVHSDVPSEPPEWRAATDESGKEFVDILYEKAVGEGIAKVRHFPSTNILVEFWILVKLRPVKLPRSSFFVD